jgi:hypothetical protein
MCTFVAPKFIKNYTNTKTLEEPRYCYYPVRSYKGLPIRGVYIYLLARAIKRLISSSFAALTI